MTDRSASTEYSNDTSPLAASGLLAKLGATIPLVSAPMAGGPSTPALVLAAAEAGGLGMLAGGYKSPKQLAEQITEVRTGISTFGVNLFGVNLFAPNPVPIDKDAFVEYTETLRELAATYDLSLNEVEALEDDDEWAEKWTCWSVIPCQWSALPLGFPLLRLFAGYRKPGHWYFRLSPSRTRHSRPQT